MLPRDLWGGAIRADVPSTMVDCSALRDLPDNQEMWADEATGHSLILELLQRQDDVSDTDAPQWHFCNYVLENTDTLPTIRSLETILGGGTITIGTMEAAKFREAARNTVLVVQLLVRLPPPASTDLLVSYNAPLVLHAESSESRAVTSVSSTPLDEASIRTAVCAIATSLHVVDSSLFC